MTANHWAEYIAKQSATHQGPGAANVSRRRSHQGSAWGLAAAAACRAGTAWRRATSASTDNPASAHHHTRQPKAPMHSGPSSSASAVASGM